MRLCLPRFVDRGGQGVVHVRIPVHGQVNTPHDGCKQGIDQQMFERKSISR